MKRSVYALLALCLLLAGCGLSAQRLREPVTFYYPRGEYRYGGAESVIAFEQRESSGHSRDLNYLLGMYLTGPASEELVSPLPQGVKLVDAQRKADGVHIILSDTSALSEAEYSLACACLTLTVTEITGAETVTVQSGERQVAMTRSQLIVTDGGTTSTTEETQ